MKKRGLSSVVTSLILILLVLVAVFIVWAVVRAVVESGSDEISLDKFNVNINIENAFVDENPNDVHVRIKRGSGKGDLVGMLFIFDGTQREDVRINESLDQLQERTFIVHLESLDVAEAENVSVALVYETESGKEVLSDVVDYYKISEGVEEVPVICSEGETRQCGTSDVGECSYGMETCTDNAWGSCVGNIEPTTEICGNGLDENCDGSDELCPEEGVLDPIGDGSILDWVSSEATHWRALNDSVRQPTDPESDSNISTSSVGAIDILKFETGTYNSITQANVWIYVGADILAPNQLNIYISFDGGNSFSEEVIVGTGLDLMGGQWFNAEFAGLSETDSSQVQVKIVNSGGIGPFSIEEVYVVLTGS